MKICFTGHRKLHNSDDISQKLIELLENLIEQGATDFYAGGAVGFDMLCERVVISLREKYPHIRLHLILPCCNVEQTAEWTYSERKEFFDILESVDSIEYTSEHLSENCMKIRNARLVEVSDCCICYYNGRLRSGTGQTVRMAKKNRMTIFNIAK